LIATAAPASAEAGFHTPPDTLLAIWLDGSVEFEVEDIHGKGHISRHPPEGQNLILVMLPNGLDLDYD
jgi:hypothetical protein